MELSNYQKDIINFVKNEKGNAIIEAFSGSAKTTTLVECANNIGNGNNLFVAFNKKIQMELSKRLEHTNMKATTLHALGYSIIMSQIARGNKVEVDNKKIGNIINELNIRIDRDEFYHYFKAISYIKNMFIDYNSDIELDNMFEEMNVGLDNKALFYTNLRKIMNRNNSMIFNIDFDDMIYLPLVNNIKKMPKDWIMADECQDFSNSQSKLLDLFIGAKTRVIFSGDKFQSIYSFRGAHSGIMAELKEKYKCKTFKLPITYRCPKSHLSLVNSHVPNIIAYEKNSVGIVSYCEHSDLWKKMEDNAVFIARTNKYVTETVLQLLKNKRKATAFGKDIGKSLQVYIKQKKCKDINEFIDKMQRNAYDIDIDIAKIETILKNENDFNVANQHKYRMRMLSNELDIIETILILCEECTTMQELDNLIDKIFSDNIEGIICSTVHKVKGLEFDNVYVMQNKLPMSWNNQSDEDRIQELNLHYVAHTRSKHKLVLVKKNEKR
ncbi:MAG: ATP-dependent helicase [Spirochaetia bacterium]|nr:ATP-dependent helicase [Spirochaetia bacterium]